jgi:parallel beta-helix repeat protein
MSFFSQRPSPQTGAPRRDRIASLRRLSARAGQVSLALALAVTFIGQPTPAAGASSLVLCDGRTFDGYASSPFKLDGGVYADASVRKIIRNCTFRNSDVPGIRLVNARNVLIEGNTFQNIRTHVPGTGVHAIAIPGAKLTDGATIRNNVFRDIGADGIQISDSGRLASNVTIEGNAFYGSEAVGENGVDVKGSNGPIYIRRNLISGFRACQSPKLGGSQDCSGDPGTGMVIHNGRASGRANNVTVEGNTFRNNGPRGGLVVSDADNTRILSNVFEDNSTYHVLVTDVAAGCVQSGNSFAGTGSFRWGPCRTQ